MPGRRCGPTGWRSTGGRSSRECCTAAPRATCAPRSSGPRWPRRSCWPPSVRQSSLPATRTSRSRAGPPRPGRPTSSRHRAAHRWRTPREPCRNHGQRIGQLLHVVQHQHHVPTANGVSDHVFHGRKTCLWQAQGTGDGSQRHLIVGGIREQDKTGFDLCIRPQRIEQIQRNPGFAHAAWPGEGDQAHIVAQHQLAQIIGRLFATDQRRGGSGNEWVVLCN